MDINFSEEQQMIRDSAKSFLSKNCPTSLVREMEVDEKGYTEKLWKGMAELGWMGLVSPEEYGGTGMGFLDLIVLVEEMGKVLLPGPFFSSAILGGFSFVEAGNDLQKKEFLPKIAKGELIFTLAINEAESAYDPSSIEVSAVADGDDYIITGTKLFVPDAHVADYILCAARTSKSSDLEGGLTFFIVNGKAPGISIRLLKNIARGKQFEMVFNDVKVPKKNILGELDEGYSPMRKVLQKAAVAKCAEMVGGGQWVLDTVVAYAKEREQFGKPIGAFQAIQHHCSNILVDLETCRWVTYKTAWMIDEGMPYDMQVSIAKAWCNQAYRRILVLGHQVMGGIGYMEEHDLPLYFRRARETEVAFGDKDYHQRIVADQLFSHGLI